MPPKINMSNKSNITLDVSGFPPREDNNALKSL